MERILDLFARTKTNREFIDNAKRMRFLLKILSPIVKIGLHKKIFYVY